jgi:RNA polymerase sigma-70 factor (ECF subfamily)
VSGSSGVLEDDRQLLDGFRRGDRAALSRVYEAYVGELELVARRGFVTGMQAEFRVPGAPPEDVRDIVQETFVRAFAPKARDGYDGLRPYRPYLLRILKNLMIDRVRKLNREVAEGEDGVGDIDAAIDRNEALRLDAPMLQDEALRWKRLHEAYDEYQKDLDTEERELVRLRYDEGMSQRDAADAMGATRRRVRTVEERIRTSLAGFLKKRNLMD